MTAGRPSTYSDEITDRICERLADGESLLSICSDDDMPAKATVFRWLGDKDHQDFRDKYARARETQADTLFDEIVDIVDDGRNDWVERTGRDGKPFIALNDEAIARSRLRMDARKWMAGKLRPQKYGDKIAHVGGEPGVDQPMQLGVVIEPGEAYRRLIKGEG